MRLRLLLAFAAVALVSVVGCKSAAPSVTEQQPSQPAPVSASVVSTSGLTLKLTIPAGELDANTTQTADLVLVNSSDTTVSIDAEFSVRVLDASGTVVYGTRVEHRRHPFSPRPLAPGAALGGPIEFRVAGPGAYALRGSVRSYPEYKEVVEVRFRARS